MDRNSSILAEQKLKRPIRFEDISVTVEGTNILESVSATIPPGGCTCIMGPNGAGKTTLVLAFLGQIPFRGKIYYGKNSNAERTTKPNVGYVPQRLAFDRGMPLTVQEFLVIRHQWRPIWLGLKPSLVEKARSLLQLVEAEHLALKKLGALSGGELQRVLLALALGQNPEILLLDEPAAGLDFKGENLFCEILEKLRDQLGFTQIMVTHDLGLAQHHASHAILLNRKVIAEGDPKEILTSDYLAVAYGVHMGGATGQHCAREPNPAQPLEQ